jgi:AcrR family transcriptional regulator
MEWRQGLGTPAVPIRSLSNRFERVLNSAIEMARTTSHEDGNGTPPTVHALTGTKLRIAEAALETLKTSGFAGASARTIAHTGGFNQALIFYHFGSVQNALLGALDVISERRLADYGAALEQARTASELGRLARAIYDEDLERGYITALGEMVSGGVSDEILGTEVAARIEPWVAMVECKLEELLAGSPLRALAPPKDLAFGIVSFYFGVDMLSHIQRDRGRAESLLDLATRLATLAEAVLPAGRQDPS